MYLVLGEKAGKAISIFSLLYVNGPSNESQKAIGT